jgi:glycosyltransferase involved in cell wall biosynthesis
MMLMVAIASLICALVPAVIFANNRRLYREPRRGAKAGPPISVLIPARDEEIGIGAAVASVMANTGATFEVLVGDDGSTDRTAEIARAAGAKVIAIPALPAGWCGKQHACAVLARHASHPVLVFLDADVRLAPDALARMGAFLDESKVDLASGFPRQETGTILENLLIPQILFVLLGFLPLRRMRRSRHAAYGAGCGQLFIARRAAYEAAGGHARIRATLHDGLKLPRLFRAAGFTTDLFDATNLATCRMYRTNRDVWRGLLKNATEGLGAPSTIIPMSVILLLGQAAPWCLIWTSGPACRLGWLALAFSLIPRFAGRSRFYQSGWNMLLHPVGVLLLVFIQWQALAKSWCGLAPRWRGRIYPVRA